MDNNEEISQIGELLFEHHMIYQQKLRRDIRQKEFAEYIGVDDKLYNHIYRGRRKPSKKLVKFLADFFDDLRFYDAVGEPRPDANLFYVLRNWEDIPNAVQKQIADIVGRYTTKKK